MPNIMDRVEDSGVAVRLHKLIYKFQEDIEDVVHDIKLKEAVERGSGMLTEVIGSSNVL